MRYAVVDHDGNVVSIERSIGDAVSEAGDLAPNVQVESDPTEPSGAALGDLGLPPAAEQPQAALARSALPVLDFESDVMGLSLEAAYAELRPFFPRRMKAYETAKGLAETLLGTNFKLAKGDPRGAPADVQGLNLLPHRLAFQISQTKGRSLPVAATAKSTFCLGSNDACQAACLAHTGRNAFAYSTQIKLMRSRALLNRPREFLRALAWAIERHERNSRARGDEPFVRMNVLSDIPWELVAPGLFAHFPDQQFYDYTKVPDREPPANYDLTFSFSGTNFDWVKHEVNERGRRIAVVFMYPPPGEKRIKAELRPEGQGLPGSLWKLPVIDGDVSDVRSRDAAPVVVGLRWKIPKTKKGQAKRESSFVVPVVEVEGHLLAALAAADQPIEDPPEDERDQWLDAAE